MILALGIAKDESATAAAVEKVAKGSSVQKGSIAKGSSRNGNISSLVSSFRDVGIALAVP